jgi:hypothetical protein
MYLLQTITPVLGTIFSLKDLQRAPGQSGQFNRCVTTLVFLNKPTMSFVSRYIQKSQYGFQEQVYINSRGHISPWPASLVVQVRYVNIRRQYSCSLGLHSILPEPKQLNMVAVNTKSLYCCCTHRILFHLFYCIIIYCADNGLASRKFSMDSLYLENFWPSGQVEKKCI